MPNRALIGSDRQPMRGRDPLVKQTLPSGWKSA